MHLLPNVSVFFLSLPSKPHTLPLVRHLILSWVESFLYASRKVLWLDWLAPTVAQRCERHKMISVILEAFFGRSSACLLLHRMKFRLRPLLTAVWTEVYWICFRVCPFLGSWHALLFGEVHVRAG